MSNFSFEGLEAQILKYSHIFSYRFSRSVTGWHTGRDKILEKKKTFLHHKRKDRLCCLQKFEYPSVLLSARGNTRLSKQHLESNLSPKGGWYCFDLVMSDRFALIWTALLRYSLRHLTSWFIVSCVSQFYLTPASGGAGIASACCHGCKTNLCGMKKDLPWSPAQRAAYLCTVWTTCRNLTTGEWKHAILKDLLTDQEQEGRGVKKTDAYENSKAVCLTVCHLLSLYSYYFFHPSCPAIFLAVKWLERPRSGSLQDEILKRRGTF